LQEISVGYVESFASEILGETRELEIRLPGGYDVGADSYPVFVVLDGGAWFRYLVSILDMISPNHLPEMIVVGLPNTNRRRDLDPADRSLGEVGDGARRFQRFLIEELLPHIDHQYRTAPYRILAGHSLAGLAVMYNMITNPEAFDARFASSPSVVSGGRGELIREGVERLNAGEMPSRFLLLSAGGMEPPELHEAVADLAQLLEERSDGGLRTEWRIYEGEGHFPIKGFYEGLRMLFGDWFPADEDPVGRGRFDGESYGPSQKQPGCNLCSPGNGAALPSCGPSASKAGGVDRAGLRGPIHGTNAAGENGTSFRRWRVGSKGVR
jgi:predicted alpha/beta superfamily hydrolase